MKKTVADYMVRNLLKTPPFNWIGPKPEDLIDPRLFGDGVGWAQVGMDSLNRGMTGSGWNTLRHLYAHFEAGGEICHAMIWLHDYSMPKATLRERRCVVSYVVRWVRVRLAQKRMEESAFQEKHTAREELRKAIRGNLPSQSPEMFYRSQGGHPEIKISVQLSMMHRAAAENLIDDFLVKNLRFTAVARPSYVLVDMHLTPEGVVWLMSDLLPGVTTAIQGLNSARLNLGNAARQAGQALLNLPTPNFSLLSRPIWTQEDDEDV